MSHLQMQDFGSLPKPRLLGRMFRFLLGCACLSGLYEVGHLSSEIINAPFTSLPRLIWLSIGPLCVMNYVVNIGFGVNWRQLPVAVSIATIASLFLATYLLTGNPDHWVVGIVVLAWLGYFYAHLGISFILASIISTPGCEMRAIPQFFGYLSGKPAQEHQCPVSFITKFDEWESALHE